MNTILYKKINLKTLLKQKIKLLNEVSKNSLIKKKKLKKF